MMKEIKNLEELKNKAIAITNSIEVFHPQFYVQETLVPEISSTLEKCYGSNNGIVAFQCNDTLYVIPFVRRVTKILQENGFVPTSMYVPFSNWDYPIEDQTRWENLLESAYEQRLLDFITDCNKYSDEHGIGTLNESLMEKCFEIPSGGIHVRLLHSESSYYFPELMGTMLDSSGAAKIGTFATNNGTCVFIYRDGKTYVTRNWEVVKALRKAGYVKGDLFVPFSNGETIQDPTYSAKWKILSA